MLYKTYEQFALAGALWRLSSRLACYSGGVCSERVCRAKVGARLHVIGYRLYK